MNTRLAKTRIRQALLALGIILCLTIPCYIARAQTCGTLPPTAHITLPTYGDVEIQNMASSVPGGNSNLNVRGTGFTFTISYFPASIQISPQVMIDASNKWSSGSWEPGAVALSSFNDKTDQPVDLTILSTTHPEHFKLWQTIEGAAGELAQSQDFWTFANMSDDDKAYLTGILTDIAGNYYAPNLNQEIVWVRDVVERDYETGKMMAGLTIQGSNFPVPLNVLESADPGVIYVSTEGMMPVDRYHLTLNTIDEKTEIYWDLGNPLHPMAEGDFAPVISKIRETLTSVESGPYNLTDRQSELIRKALAGLDYELAITYSKYASHFKGTL